MERLGGRLGGLLAAVPSTIVPATLGFWWASADQDSYHAALYSVPGAMLVNACFLYCWRFFPTRFSDGDLHRLLTKVALSALLVWAILALGLVTLARSGWIPIHVMGFSCLALQMAAGVASCRNYIPAPKGTQSVGLWTLLMRGLLAGSAISFSVWLAGLGNPVLAGVASVFPAIFLTTMISVWLAQGKAVPMGAVGPIMLGSSSVSVFALSAVWSLPALGALWGSLASWLFAVCVISVPAWLYLRAPEPKPAP